MSEVSDVELGKLIQQISTLEVMVKEQNVRLDKLDQQLERTRGIGIGIVLATVGLSGVGASLSFHMYSNSGVYTWCYD